MASPTQVRAAVMAVRPYGRAVLMGGVGMLGGPGLELPYPWIMRNCVTIHGVWMYPPEAVVSLVKLVRSGLVGLRDFEVTSFDLDRANEAVANAAANAGPFAKTVIRPWRLCAAPLSRRDGDRNGVRNGRCAASRS